MTDMQRAGWVRTDELDLDFLALTYLREAILFSLNGNLVKNLIPTTRRQGKVDKTRPRDLDFAQELTIIERFDQGFSNLPRCFLFGACHSHGQIRGKITVIWVSRDFNLHIRNDSRVQGTIIKAGLQSVTDLLPQTILHDLFNPPLEQGP